MISEQQTRLPSCSCKNPGEGCSSAPSIHPSRWASDGPGTWRRETSGADGYRSYCEKLNHIIVKNFRHLRNSQFQNHQWYPYHLYHKQLCLFPNGTDLFCINLIWKVLGFKDLIFSSKLDINNKEGRFGFKSWLSHLCDFGQIT